MRLTAFFLAEFRFDTAENEPAKNLQNFRKMHFSKIHFSKMHFSKMHFFASPPTRARARWRPSPPPRRVRSAAASGPQLIQVRSFEPQSLIFQPNDQTLQGSFSSVSTPNFARKYSLERLKLLTRSRRFTCFCTARTSIFQQNCVKLFRIFRQT